MSPSAISGYAQNRSDEVQIPTQIAQNLNKNGFMFAFREFMSLSSRCGGGYADHP